MIDQRDKDWLKKVLRDFDDISNHLKSNRRLESFKILVENLVRNIERNVNEINALWEKEPKSKELRKKFSLLKKYLFYLKRYCNSKIK